MSKKQRQYDEEFKRNALDLLKKPGVSRAMVCQDLGIASSTLYTWGIEEKTHGEQAFPGKGHLHPDAAKLKGLRRELDLVTEERDILKKALAIFSSPSKRNLSS